MVNFSHMMVHCLVAKAFLPPPPSEEHTTIDHIDQNADNNCAQNLRWATRSQQKINQRAGKKPQRTARAMIVKNGEKDERFVCARLAAECLGVSVDQCRTAAKKGSVINGCTVRYDEDFSDMEGEVWKTTPDDETLRVSNQGRLQRFNKKSKAWAQKIVPDGNPRCGGYCIVKVCGKAWTVHRLVATLFLDAPTDPLQCTVDHKNRIRTDNRASNLRWATTRQQRLNQVRN